MPRNEGVNLKRNQGVNLKRIEGVNMCGFSNPTQKPEQLLEKIIKASTNKGDIIFDAYAGCGTTIA
ncbi:MAG: DNA methyltransferase, partial [Chloroflexi bacterium]|nr:DNA methyltransferase [Chloroflexota bacterium]